jgi:hypothetical protein
MNAVGQTLWDHIETKLMGSKSTGTDWKNTLDYGVIVDEPNLNEMVTEKFGGFNKAIEFRNGTAQYRMKVLPVQNKNTRDHHAYGSVRGGGENKVNIVAWPAAGGGNVFNLHVQVRKAAYVVTTTVDEDGFVSRTRGGRRP